MSVVYVHIGLPKTGTTHLQNRLWRNRDTALKVGDLLYPGDRIDDHFHAAVGLQPDRYLDWVDPSASAVWRRLLGQMRSWPGTSLLSHELFSTATGDQVAALLADLDFADEIHVVATVRDLARQLPSVWQENVKNQRRADFDDFVANVRDHTPTHLGMPVAVTRPDLMGSAGGPEPFWEFQDYVGILATWAAHVGPDRMHVVTVPRESAPGDDLWSRFVGVLGVDAAALTAAVPKENTSLSASRAEFLRLLNGRLQPGDIAWERYERIVKEHLIGDILFASPNGRPRSLNTEQRAWASELSDIMTAQLESAGYHLVGSPADLAVTEEADAGAENPGDTAILDVALDTLAVLVKTAPLPRAGYPLRSRALALARHGRRRLQAVRTSAWTRRARRMR